MPVLGVIDPENVDNGIKFHIGHKEHYPRLHYENRPPASGAKRTVINRLNNCPTQGAWKVLEKRSPQLGLAVRYASHFHPNG
jgi:hypothetical protein